MLEDDEQLRLRFPARFGFEAAELFVMIEEGAKQQHLGFYKGSSNRTGLYWAWFLVWYNWASFNFGL
jgi:hypothetical protein